VREAASVLEFAWAPGPGNRDRVEGGCDNFIKVWIAQAGDEVHTYERLCGRKLDVDQLSREMHEPWSKINPYSLGALDWLRRYSRRLIAMWEQGDVLVTPTLARRAAGRRADRGPPAREEL
jgi:hypothetical protein